MQTRVVSLLCTVIMLAGCAMKSPSSHSPEDPEAYNVSYYPQQEPFYAAAAEPVDPAAPPLPSGAGYQCKAPHHRHPHYHGKKWNDGMGHPPATPVTYIYQPYPVNQAMLYPNNLHSYNWDYWRSRQTGGQ